MYQLSVKPEAQKSLNRLPKEIYERVLAALALISSDPFVGKPLNGKWAGRFSYRTGAYRIIYSLHRRELLVLVIKVGHRQGVYKSI